MSESGHASWKAMALVSLLGVVAATAVAGATGLWVLTAAPVGFLFGFFLERADLCGASAVSEVVLFKDTRKLAGLWTVVVVSMVAFALGVALGWIQLNPKPLRWASYLLGGGAFGVGMVLAGGCVSGALFKAGQGNLNSMVALLGIPLGIAAVEYGPLQGLHRSLKGTVISSAAGGPVTVPSVTGLPYWLLAVVIAGGTLAVAIVVRRRRDAASRGASPATRDTPVLERVLTRPWAPWQSGLAIGVLALAAYASSAASGRNYPLGVTHGVLHVELLVTESPVRHVWQPTAVQPRTPGQVEPAAAARTPKPRKKVVWWLVALVSFLVLGAHVSARMRGSFRLLPKPPDETLVAFVGGLLVGAGAALATGCVVGNIMSGVALMSVGNILFVVVVVLANWVTTYLYLMGRDARGA